MRRKKDVITVLAKHGFTSKLVCCERGNLIENIGIKLGIQSSFHIEEYDKNSEQWHEKTCLTVTQMGMVRVVIEDVSLNVNSRKTSSDNSSCKESQSESSCGTSSQSTSAIASPDIKHQRPGLKGSEIILRLKDEVIKDEKERDLDLIEHLLEENFEERHNFILQKASRVREIKRMYPILFEEKYLLAELERILHGNCVSQFSHNLELYSSAIIATISEKCFLDVLKTEKQKCMDAVLSVKMVTALLVLPSIFNNPLNQIILFDVKRPRGRFPVILSEASISEVISSTPLFEIYAEGVFICKVNNLVKAYIVYMSLFFMFNISYPRKCMECLTLIETLLLGHKTEEDLPAVKKIRNKFTSSR